MGIRENLEVGGAFEQPNLKEFSEKELLDSIPQELKDAMKKMMEPGLSEEERKERFKNAEFIVARMLKESEKK